MTSTARMRNLSPPPSPSRRRSPTPDPIRHTKMVDERPRSSSFSELTPRAILRSLPSLEDRPHLSQAPSQLRSLFSGHGHGHGHGHGANSQTSGGGGSAPLGAALSSRKGSALSIRDPVASGRASPALSTLSMRQNSSTGFRVGEGDAAVRPVDDVWQAVCVRVLPLFNGEGVRGFVEELNDLVNSHVQRTIARCQTRKATIDTASLVTGLLTADLSELLSVGFLTLMSKLVPEPPTPPLSDDKLLQRLNEVWHFFWTNILPHLESIFWSLRSDERLRATVSSREAQGSRHEARLDIRRLALIGFRDHLVLPQINRITTLFRELFESRPPSRQPPLEESTSGLESSTHDTYSPSLPMSSSSTANFNLKPPLPVPPGPSASLQASNARRRQMVFMLCSLLTGDDRQNEMDSLLRTMRTGNVNVPASANTPSPDLRRIPSETRSLSEGEGFPVMITHNLPLRSRAGTMDSLDEEEASTFTVGGASMTPQATPATVRGRRKGFLPRLKKSKSAASSLAMLENDRPEHRGRDRKDSQSERSEG